MRVLFWLLVMMTGLAAGVTIFEAAMGSPIRWGVVATGLAISVAGVFFTALWDDFEPEQSDQ